MPRRSVEPPLPLFPQLRPTSFHMAERAPVFPRNGGRPFSDEERTRQHGDASAPRLKRPSKFVWWHICSPSSSRSPSLSCPSEPASLATPIVTFGQASLKGQSGSRPGLPPADTWGAGVVP